METKHHLVRSTAVKDECGGKTEEENERGGKRVNQRIISVGPLFLSLHPDSEGTDFVCVE